jgi:hypothetical protein
MGKIFSIYLRQPSDRTDDRIDPLYNKGCFGSTGCHSKNILNQKHMNEFSIGIDRLCFMQGGSDNTKIVFITPPILAVVNVQEKLILKWNSQSHRPLKYEYGLQLTKSLARKLNKNIQKEKPVEELYQHFRSRTKAVDDSDLLLAIYEEHINDMKKSNGDEIFANKNYETFKHIAKPEFYNNKSDNHCSSLCRDRTCIQKQKNCK